MNLKCSGWAFVTHHSTQFKQKPSIAITGISSNVRVRGGPVPLPKATPGYAKSARIRGQAGLDALLVHHGAGQLGCIGRYHEELSVDKRGDVTDLWKWRVVVEKT